MQSLKNYFQQLLQLINRRLMLVLAGSVLLVGSCLYGSGNRSWSEDVLLPSGEQFVVKRKIKGNANHAGIGEAGAWIYKSTEIHFPQDIAKAPQMWDGKYMPMVIGRYADGAFYMVATFQERADYFELYWEIDPLPLSYVQFNWTGSQWQMQKALDPSLMGLKANLLIGSPGKDGPHHWTVEAKEQRDRTITPRWYYQVIGGEHPSPPKQNQNGRRNAIKFQNLQKSQGEKT